MVSPSLAVSQTAQACSLSLRSEQPAPHKLGDGPAKRPRVVLTGAGSHGHSIMSCTRRWCSCPSAAWMAIWSPGEGTRRTILSVGGSCVILLNTKQSVLIPANSQSGLNSLTSKFDSHISMFALSYIFCVLVTCSRMLGFQCVLITDIVLARLCYLLFS